LAHAAHDLVVDSVTGVDVSMAVAGTGARALAFLIDLLIRAVLVTAWYVVATLVYNGAWTLQAPIDPEGTWYLYVAVPAAGIYTLYHLAMEIALRGRTPGKRMVGVRLVTRNGAVPSTAAFIVRNVFRLVDSFPVGYGVGLITSLVTRDHVRVGDLAAGTLLVYDNPHALDAERITLKPASARLDLDTAEVISELLGRWHTLDRHVRERLAQTLLARAGDAAAGASATDDELRAKLERMLANRGAAG
jgi:uncharacterized RDD family membrane protein YckC